MQTFGNHLSADDDVDFTLPKCLERITQGIFFAHGIGIDSCEACLGEYFFEHSFHLFRAVTLKADGGIATFRAFPRSDGLVPADVTNETFRGPMIREGKCAMATFTDVAATGALQRSCKSAAIEKQDNLFSFCELFLHVGSKWIGENGRATFVFFTFNSHIDDPDDGHRLPVGTFVECE